MYCAATLLWEPINCELQPQGDFDQSLGHVSAGVWLGFSCMCIKNYFVQNF